MSNIVSGRLIARYDASDRGKSFEYFMGDIRKYIYEIESTPSRKQQGRYADFIMRRYCLDKDGAYILKIRDGNGMRLMKEYLVLGSDSLYLMTHNPETVVKKMALYRKLH